MLQFFGKSIAFFTLLLILLILFGEIRISDKYLIYKTKGTDYDKVAWNLDIILNHSERVKNSIVFLGSSLVQSGICDSTLNVNGIKSLNFGVSHFGNDLSLYFLDRMKLLDPKAIIFLKKKDRYTKLHKLTPLLYSPIGLIRMGQRFNLYYIEYLFKRIKHVFEFCCYILLNEDTQELRNYDFSGYGVRYSKITMEFDSISFRSDETHNLYLNDHIYNDELNSKSFLTKIKVVWRKFLFKTYHFRNHTSQENFVESANEICKENNIKFYKIYIPLIIDTREDYDYQRQMYFLTKTDNDVLCLSSFTFLNNQEYWADTYHLNKKGALLFTLKLIEKEVIISQ